MSFEDAMRRMLPPLSGVGPHVTGDFGEQRASGPHGGTDFNYEGGQAGVNMQRPTVHAPVAGEVVFSGGNFGTVKIRDADGNTHEILHMQGRLVEVGDRIEAGGPIGTMGGRGPGGANQYAQHVHYQMKNAAGQAIDPQAWWDARVASNDQALAGDGTQLAVNVPESAPETQALFARLLGDSEWGVRALAERHGLAWDQGMVNTVCAAAACARQAGLTEINLFTARDGALKMGQHDGLVLREASLDARGAANTPDTQSLAGLEQWDQKSDAVGDAPPMAPRPSGQGLATPMAR